MLTNQEHSAQTHDRAKWAMGIHRDDAKVDILGNSKVCGHLLPSRII